VPEAGSAARERVTCLLQLANETDITDETVVQKPAGQKDDGSRTACLIVLSGQATGRLYRITDSRYLIGRGRDASIKLEEEGVSRKHAQIVRYKDDLFLLKDLGSTNGTYINGKQVKSQVLNDGDRVQVGSVCILKFSYQDDLEEQFQQQLYASATHDALTMAHNKRFFDDQLRREVSHVIRHKSSLALILLDIDHFKAVNDTHGHQAGDAVLKDVAMELSRTLRLSDTFCRIGGEEFAVILRDSTAAQARQTAERLRQLCEAKKFAYEGAELSVTISLGVAEYSAEQHENPAALVREADHHLYEAKRNGRNCVSGA